MPLTGKPVGKAEGKLRPVSQETGPAERNENTVGCDGQESIMTTKTIASAKTQTLASVLLVALIGVTTLFVAGHAQSQVLHDAAHDVRHATGFTCH
jgi:cobalt transporter subunit CbtB